MFTHITIQATIHRQPFTANHSQAIFQRYYDSVYRFFSPFKIL